MLTKFQAEVDKLLECSVCLEEFKQPKMLKCQHSFCLNPCLKNMSKVEARPNGGLWTALQCAICCQKHFVDDLNTLPDFLLLKNLIQIRKNQLESTENADTGIISISKGEVLTLKKFNDFLKLNFKLKKVTL